MPPQWFFTGSNLPQKINDRIPFQEFVSEYGPYCGFARLRIDVTNLSPERVYINGISIKKDPLEGKFETRFQYIPQGAGKPPLYMVGTIDEEAFNVYQSFEDAHDPTKGYFDNGYMIEFEPGEARVIFLTLVCFSGLWKLSINFEYRVGSKGGYLPIGNQPIILGAYDPPSLINDSHQCVGLLDSEEAFEDRSIFVRYGEEPSRENRNAILDYLESIIDLF